MRIRIPAVGLLGTALLVMTGLPAEAASAPTPAETGVSVGVAEIPISFSVQNVNRSKVACAVDGANYTVRGHLVAPRRGGVVDLGSDTATLYLHGLGLGEFFWRFQDVPGYDYAADQARAGQVSVVVDRLGYDSSDKPPGEQICLGSQADIAHQMVVALRSGDYTLGQTATAPTFGSVVLAGHSFGAFIAQIEAYSFGDIDGLINMDYSDTDTSTLERSLAAVWTARCADGPGQSPTDNDPAVGPLGYVPFGPPPTVGPAFFNKVDPQVFAAAGAMFNNDPCGDSSSAMAGTTADLQHLDEIQVPVLVLFGLADTLFPAPAGSQQAAKFTGSTSVTYVPIPTAAHAVTLERSHVLVEQTVQSWLTTVIEAPATK